MQSAESGRKIASSTAPAAASQRLAGAPPPKPAPRFTRVGFNAGNWEGEAPAEPLGASIRLGRSLALPCFETGFPERGRPSRARKEWGANSPHRANCRRSCTQTRHSQSQTNSVGRDSMVAASRVGRITPLPRGPARPTTLARAGPSLTCPRQLLQLIRGVRLKKCSQKKLEMSHPLCYVHSTGTAAARPNQPTPVRRLPPTNFLGWRPGEILRRRTGPLFRMTT